MRCKLDRGLLADTLGAVASTLPNRTTYPVLQNVLLDVVAGKLAITGTDLDTFVRKEMPLEGEVEDGRVVIPGRKLMEIVRESGVAEMLVYSKNGGVHVEAGRNKAVFSGLDPAEFPEMPKPPEGATLEFPIGSLLELFDAVAFAVSKDDSRPAMCGVNWEVTKTEMKMVATDGHRLGLASRKGKYPATCKLIASPKLFALLPREQDTVTVSSDPSKVGLVTPDTTIIGRQIEGPYPDYDRVIPKGHKPSVATVEQEPLSAALRRAMVFAHPVGKLVALSLAKGTIKFEAETPELGQSEEDFACDYAGKEMRIGFNASYMIDVLRHIRSEKIAIELQGPLAAGVIRPVEAEGDLAQTYLLMPIRLD